MTNTLDTPRFRRQSLQGSLTPNTQTYFTPDVEAYKALISRPDVARLTPQNRITAAKEAWFAADTQHARAFIRADRIEMARLDLLRESILDSYLLLLQHEKLDALIAAQADETPQTVEPEDDDSLPLEPLTDVIEEVESDELTRARRACMAAVNKAGLSTDSLTMCGAYLNYFNEYAGTTRKNWTVAMWRKMKNAVSAGVWRGESGQWQRVSYRRAA